MSLNQSLYNTFIKFFKDQKKHYTVNTILDDKASFYLEKEISNILAKHKAYGANFAIFSDLDVLFSISYGNSDDELAVYPNTFFRVASISKMILSTCVLKLFELGKIDLDADLNEVFGKKIVNGYKISFRTLLSHTAGIHDGDSYNKYVGTGYPLSKMLVQDNFRNFNKTNKFEYSNLGFGMIASALEILLRESFEILMQKQMFQELGMEASYYPQTLQRSAANAYKVFPFRKLALNVKERRQRSLLGYNKPDPEQHYILAPGNCYTNMDGAVKIANALLRPGFLQAETLQMMRTPYADFGDRDKRLQQGLGLFIVSDRGAHFLGHQGLAYGAVHGLFFDPMENDGMVLMTAGCSKKRNAVLADINLDLIKVWNERKLWKK